MPIPPLNLDDRTFTDLVDEIRALIPRHTRAWTDHNISDPGIMLIELLAWLTEAMIYRINRVPAASRMRFLELLGAIFQAAQPAVLKLVVTAHVSQQSCTLPRGTVIYARSVRQAEPIAFETLHDLTLTPNAPTDVVTVRQTARVADEQLGMSNQESYQLFTLNHPSIALPQEPFPRRPKVIVGDTFWTYRTTLHTSEPDDEHFTVKPWLNAIAFGDGVHGKKPEEGLPIQVTYRTAPTTQGVIRREIVGASSGAALQIFRLRHPVLALDLQERSELEPRLTVDDQPWDYQPRFLDLTVGAAEFTVEPWLNAIRFGDGDNHGQVPQEGATIRLTYRSTLGAGGNVPRGATFSVQAGSGATNIPGLAISENFKIVTPGVDPTDLEDARDQAFAILAPRWRTITAIDFTEVIAQRQADIARVTPLPGQDLANAGQTINQPGDISVILTPRARYELAQPPQDMGQIFAISPDGRRLLTLVTHNGATAPQLWNMENGRKLAQIAVPNLQQAQFGPDSRCFVTRDEQGVADLWNAETGAWMALLMEIEEFQFSPNGRRLLTRHSDGTARLWNTDDGSVVPALSGSAPVGAAVFSPDDQWLATTHDDNAIRLWNAHSGQLSAIYPHDSAISTVRFSPSGEQLASLDDEGVVRLWRIPMRSPPETLLRETASAARPASEEPVAVFPHDDTVTGLTFSPDGTRLVTWGDNAGAHLWSTRSRKKLATLVAGATIDHMLFDPTHRLLAAAGHEGNTTTQQNVIYLWDARSGARLDDLPQDDPIKALAFSPNGQRLAAIDSEDQLSIWKIGVRQRAPLIVDVQPLPATQRMDAAEIQGADTENAAAPRGTIQTALLNAAGKWAATIQDNLLYIWDLEQGKPGSTFYHEPGGGPIQVIHATTTTPTSAHPTIVQDKRLFTWFDRTQDDQTRRTVRVWNAEHSAEVQALLSERGLVTSQHHVAGVGYTDLAVAATVERSGPIAQVADLQAAICDALRSFFHPLDGGPEQKGWPLGRAVYASEVYQIIEGVEGVDHVESLELMVRGRAAPIWADYVTHITIPPYHLVNCVVQPADIMVIEPDAAPGQIAANRDR